jgi:microsomal epoxide hydrolase
MAPSTRTLDIQQFRPSFSEQQLADLKHSISSSRLPAETYASKKASCGIEHGWMKTALERWQNGFNWCV